MLGEIHFPHIFGNPRPFSLGFGHRFVREQAEPRERHRRPVDRPQRALLEAPGPHVALPNGKHRGGGGVCSGAGGGHPLAQRKVFFFVPAFRGVRKADA